MPGKISATALQQIQKTTDEILRRENFGTIDGLSKTLFCADTMDSRDESVVF